MLLNAALLGFGNVGRALAELLIEKQSTLKRDYDIDLRIVGIATGSHGQVIDPHGIDLRQALETTDLGTAPSELCGIDTDTREAMFVCGLEGSDADKAQAWFTVPTSRVMPPGTGTMHVILAVTDHGEPRLTRYQRVIVDVKRP